MSKEHKPPTPSVNPIANLAAALALFEPVLVNNSIAQLDSEKEWTGEYNPIDPHKPYPNMHELLNTCYSAMGAMKDFIKEVDFLRRAHSNLTADAMQAYTAMKGERLNPGSLIEGVETLIGQKHQCFDVMDSIMKLVNDSDSRNLPSKEYCTDKIHELITKFRNRNKRVEKTPIVNNNETDGDGNILSFDPNLGIPESGFDANGPNSGGTQKPPNSPSTPTSGE